MNARAVAVNPFGDVLAQACDVISLVKDAVGDAWWLLTGAPYLRELVRRWRPKKRREIEATITFGAPTATARVSTRPPDWL